MRRSILSAAVSLLALLVFGLVSSPALLGQRGGRDGAAPQPQQEGGGALALYPKGGPGELLGPTRFPTRNGPRGPIRTPNPDTSGARRVGCSLSHPTESGLQTGAS